MSLLEVSGLTVAYSTPSGPLVAVDGVDLAVARGEFIGVAGESGCGKTTMAMAVPGLLPDAAAITAGSVRFEGRELVGLPEEELAQVRWRDIAVVFQGALNALNPVQRVGDQIAEPILLHQPGTSDADAAARARELLEAVGIPAARTSSYPHEFSGGMRQRVMIAMALACRPRLVIADEPVTALDVMTQAQILQLLRGLKDDFDLSLVMISHDLSVLAEVCDRVQVMYAGKVAEVGPAAEVFAGGAAHPYTERLLKSYPDISGPRAFADGIPGYPPNLSLPQAGCRFAARCEVAIDTCATVQPPAVAVGPLHTAACHLAGARS